MSILPVSERPIPTRYIRTERERPKPVRRSVNQGTLLPTEESETGVTDIPWAEFLAHDFDWEQGEHVTICAPTGWGKTTLGLAMLPKRDFTLVLGTKPEDDTLDKLRKEGYRVVTDLPLPPTKMYPRIIFWPKIDSPNDIPAQRDAFKAVLMNIYHSGGWTVFVDELDYVCNFLKLKPLVELLWRQGRSLGVSVVGGTQRPAFIPLLAYDQATHLFIGRDNDEVNTKRYASIAGGGRATQRVVRSIIAGLPPHHFLYLNARSGREGFITTKVG